MIKNFQKIAFSIVIISMLFLLISHKNNDSFKIQFFIFLCMAIGLLISLREKRKESELKELEKVQDIIDTEDNILDMINHKEKIEEIAKTFIAQQIVMPYSRGEEFAKKQKETEEGFELFYWGNIQKEKAKNEISDLTKFKPKLIETFILGDSAYDVNGIWRAELRPIYFKVKSSSIRNEG